MSAAGGRGNILARELRNPVFTDFSGTVNRVSGLADHPSDRPGFWRPYNRWLRCDRGGNSRAIA
ncbi:MAG: hypothetical protein GDA48_23710 [Hormoscilla sp. GM102CHS1]|nr:hypothetical protein [Hormoscilla sp. SP12CHS1]MBC6475438.1 hypothetical protein [Hormoscilla sp. GM102CHS1]